MATTSFPDASLRNDNRAARPVPRTHRGITASGTPDDLASGDATSEVCTAHASPRDVVIRGADPEFARQFGASAHDMCGSGLLDLLRTPDPARLREQFAALASGRRRQFTEKVTGHDGSGRTFSAEVTVTAVDGPSGEVASLLVLLRRTGDARRPGKGRAPALSGGPVLSALDAQVLEGVAAGESTAQLASRLYLSRQGIEYRVGQMLRRFDAPNRPALVARAHALGMFAVGQWPPRVLPERVK
ncbi:PAS domain-containing protein [Streptomyces sp. NPDC014882]|uniref:PAS domain-containing protein n=1 Tax=Streptomyces sp. NPDC014882 TaxID=3364927 RepID=UPI003701A40B